MNNFLLSKTTVPILTVMITLIMAGITVWLYRWKSKKLKSTSNNERIILYSILSFAFIIRLFIAAQFEGHFIDINCFKSWSSTASNDFAGIYSNAGSIDYPPLYVYVMFFLGHLVNFFHLGNTAWLYTLVIKMPSLITDIITAYILYFVAKKYTLQQGMAIFIASCYAFNPFIIVDSAFWGQVDSFFALLIVLTFYMINQDKILWATFFFTLSILAKPQGILFTPVFLLQLFLTDDMKAFIAAFFSRSSGKLKHNFNRLRKGATLPNIFYSLLCSAITFIVICLPFSIRAGNFTWIFKLYQKTLGEYPYATLNSANIFAVFQKNWFEDKDIFFAGITYKAFGTGAIILLCLWVLFLYFKSSNSNLPYLTAVTLISGVFCFANGMHERYMYPVISLLLLCFCIVQDKKIFIAFAVFSLTNFVNVWQVYILSPLKSCWIPKEDLLFIATGIINIIAFLFLCIIVLMILFKKNNIIKIHKKNS